MAFLREQWMSAAITTILFVTMLQITAADYRGLSASNSNSGLQIELSSLKSPEKAELGISNTGITENFRGGARAGIGNIPNTTGRDQEHVVAQVLASPCLALGSLANTSTSPIGIYSHSFRSWIDDAPYQTAIALLAVVVGLFCLWDGPSIWHMLFTITIACLGSGIAHYEIKTSGFALNTFFQCLLMLEVGATIGWAVHCGFEGSQVLFGVSLGTLGAYGVGGWARALDSVAPGISLLWYSAGAALGLLIYTVWRRPVLATSAPLLGGLLVSSGIGLVASRSYALTAQLDHGHPAPGISWLPPADASWIDVVESLLGRGGGASLAGLCGCALCAAVMHSIQHDRVSTVLIVVAGIVFSALTSSACNMAHLDCPAWLAPTVNWRWLLVGSTTWSLITAVAAWRQLKMEERSVYTHVTGSLGKYLSLAQTGQNQPKHSSHRTAVELADQQERGGMYQTRLPDNY